MDEYGTISDVRLKWAFTLVFHEKLQKQNDGFVSALEGLKIPPTTNERTTSSTVIQHILNVIVLYIGI